MLTDDFQLFEDSRYYKSQLIKSYSTRCKIRNGIVYKCTEDMEDKFKYFEHTILEYRHRSRKNFEEKIELLSYVITEMEEIVLSTNIHILQEYLLISDITLHKKASTLFCLITYHLLNTSGKENLENLQILNLIRYKLKRLKSEFYIPLQMSKEWEKILCLYLDVYYKNTPNETFANIHAIWNSYPLTELCLQLIACKQSMEANQHTTLVQLIHTNTDYFITSYEVKFAETCEVPEMAIMVMLHILNHQLSLHRTEKVKTIESILTSITKAFANKDKLFDGFANFILTLENKQLPCIPYVIETLQPLLMKCDASVILKILVLCRMKLNQANYNKECINFIKCHSQFFLSFPTNDLIWLECYYRQQYCISMLILLDGYTSCHDTFNMNMVLIKLLVFRVSLLSNIYSSSCCCFMGKQECKKCITVKSKESETLPSIDLPPIVCFRQAFMYQYSELSMNRCSTAMQDMLLPDEFNSVMENVIHGKWKLAPYLQSFVDMMNVNDYKVESFLSFKEFLKRSVVYDADILYDIIKMFSAFDIPEIQDIILQGITEVLMICNAQFGRPSKFILDINRICPKGQFLQKLTSSIAKLLLHFNEDSEYDFKIIIYQCYCTVRHESKNEKDVNIARYKEHFTFIASMEVEEEMKKLTDLTNLLLMLTLLLIASGGHHKSAELKKYLSLKYEYRDSILYLLWCSGDVEINPGPTLCTMRKLQNSEKERNWIYEMCSILLRLLKYKSIYVKNDGLWKEKPLHWPTEWPFYDPRNKPKGRGYNSGTDKTLLENLEKLFNMEVISKDITKFDEHTKSRLEEYKKELTAWKNNRTQLFEFYTLRQELDTLREAKGFLGKYRKDPEFHQSLCDLNVELVFNSTEDSNIRKEGYTDIVRDIAITFCRIGKGLNLLEKSDGMWKTPPSGWNPNHPYYSPCNAGKRKEKGQDKKLVDNLLIFCESKNKPIPSELQSLIKAWKERNTSEITKYYTIWSNMAIVKHSLQYLELENLLEKSHIQQSLKQIGLILNAQCWRYPSTIKSYASDNDDKRQDSGFNDNFYKSPCSDGPTAISTILNGSQESSSQINSDNQCMHLLNSTQINSNDTNACAHSLISHTNGHPCNINSDQHDEWDQSSKHTYVNSFQDTCPILTRKADVKHHRISSENFSNSNEQIIPCIVHIHDATSKPERKNIKISKTAKKRDRQNNDESHSEPKRLHVSEEDIPLLLNILTSPSENGKVLSNTRRKEYSKDGDIRTILPNQLSHDLISIKSKMIPSAAKKQTDQLVVKDLPDITSDKPEESSLSKREDGEIDKAIKNNKITSDQYVDKIVDLLEELDHDYSSTVVEASILNTCSSTDPSSDELPEHIQLYVDTYLNSYNPDVTLDTDIKQFIEEQGMDSS